MSEVVTTGNNGTGLNNLHEVTLRIIPNECGHQPAVVQHTLRYRYCASPIVINNRINVLKVSR
jgi:hypothetical protein